MWLVVLLCYGATLSGRLSSPDDELLFRTTEALATRGQLSIQSIWGGFASMKGVDGKDYAQYGIGQPMVAVPFYWAGMVVEKFYSGRGLKHPYRLETMQIHDRTGSDWARRFTVSWFNVFLGAAFATLLFVFAWTLSGELAPSWMVALLYALGTMAWPQSRTFFSEPLAAMSVMGSFLLLQWNLRTGSRWLALAAGGCAGYALLTRLDSVLALPGVVVFLAIAHAQADDGDNGSTVWRRFLHAQFRADAWKRWLQWGLPIVAALAIYVGLNFLHFGTWRSAYSDQPEGVNFGTPLLVGLHGYLCSIGRGIFFFSPPLFLFFWSIRSFIRKQAALGWGIVVSIVVFLGVQSMWINWAGGWCWGPRHVFMIHWMLALPILVLLTRPRGVGIRIAYGALMVVAVGIQVYGCVVHFNTYYEEHFRKLDSPPRAMALYSPEHEEHFLEQFYDIKIRLYTPELERRRPYSSVIIAPINDSVYIFQNSQWPGNARCLEYGLHDIFWLHLLRDPSSASNAE